jgi:hypothetical protein
MSRTGLDVEAPKIVGEFSKKVDRSLDVSRTILEEAREEILRIFEGLEAQVGSKLGQGGPS